MAFMSLGIRMIYLFMLLRIDNDGCTAVVSVDNNNNVNNDGDDNSAIFKNNSHFKWLIR